MKICPTLFLLGGNTFKSPAYPFLPIDFARPIFYPDTPLARLWGEGHLHALLLGVPPEGNLGSYLTK